MNYPKLRMNHPSQITRWHTGLDFPKIQVPAYTIPLSVPNMLTLLLSAFGTLF